MNVVVREVAPLNSGGITPRDYGLKVKADVWRTSRDGWERIEFSLLDEHITEIMCAIQRAAVVV